MPDTARCKFTALEVDVDDTGNGHVTLETVYDTELAQEEAAFSEYTPSGKLEFAVNNPALAGFFVEGQAYYIDISAVEPR